MLKVHSFRPYPETCLASTDWKHALSTRHTPSQNHLLAALPLEDCECYAVVKREYDRLLRPENTIGNAGAIAMPLPYSSTIAVPCVT